MDPTIAMQLQPDSATELEQSATSATSPGSETTSPELAEKFQAMLNETTPSTSVQSTGSHENLLTKAVEEQANDYRQVPNDVMYMSHHMSSLSMQRLAAADMTIQLEISSLSADLQVKMATVQSSKDAVQTLMKNQ